MLVNFLLVFVISELGAAALGAYLLWQLRDNPVAKWVGILLTALLLDSLCQVTAYAYRPHGVQIEASYAFWISTGRIIKSAGIWSLVLYLNRSTGISRRSREAA